MSGWWWRFAMTLLGEASAEAWPWRGRYPRRGAKFTGGTVRFGGAEFSGGTVDFG